MIFSNGTMARLLNTGLMALFAALVPIRASVAAERLYDRTSAWEVVLVTPDEGASNTAYCEVRTITWAAKRISVHVTLTGIDQLETGFFLEKSGWNLPQGVSTSVSVMRLSKPLPFPMSFRVIGADTLYSDGTASLTDPMAALVIVSIWETKEPDDLVLQFEGDEEPWIVPAMTLFETYQLDRSLSECQNALITMGPKLFGDGQSGQYSATSPFNKKATPPPTAQSGQPVSDDKIVANNWAFSTEDEDWGKTCFVQTQIGDVKVGFMGAPGKNLVGFVEGAFTGQMFASWQVDDKGSLMSEGNQDDYFGWHSFHNLPDTLLTDIAQGTQLTIVEFGKKHVVVVGLQGAAEAMSSFNECLGKLKSTSNAPSSPKNFRTFGK